MTFALFLIFALAAVGGALAVAFETRLWRAAFGLIMCLGGVGGIYFTIGAEILGILQLIVYVGGVVVIFLFAIVLTPLDEGELRSSMILTWAGLLVAALVGGLMIGITASAGWGEIIHEVISVEDLGNALVTGYLLPFEAISILLLAALVGAIVVLRRGLEG